ncbi:MAG: hypothetical protein AAF684_01210 [Pseudomonadota bacterium]
MRKIGVAVIGAMAFVNGLGAAAQTPRGEDDPFQDLATIETKFATNPILERMEARARATFRAIDFDEDGVVTVQEQGDNRAGTFRDIDSNGDGIMTSGEYRRFYAIQSREELPPARAGEPPERGEARISDYFWKGDVQRAFHRLDENLDGVLSRPEWEAPALWFVARYDLNRDELVEEDEYVRQILPNTRRPPPRDPR